MTREDLLDLVAAGLNNVEPSIAATSVHVQGDENKSHVEVVVDTSVGSWIDEEHWIIDARPK